MSLPGGDRSPSAHSPVTVLSVRRQQASDEGAHGMSRESACDRGGLNHPGGNWASACRSRHPSESSVKGSERTSPTSQLRQIPAKRPRFGGPGQRISGPPHSGAPAYVRRTRASARIAERQRRAGVAVYSKTNTAEGRRVRHTRERPSAHGRNGQSSSTGSPRRTQPGSATAA